MPCAPSAQVMRTIGVSCVTNDWMASVRDDLRRQVDLQDLDALDARRASRSLRIEQPRQPQRDLRHVGDAACRLPSSGTSHGRIAIVVRSSDSSRTRASTNSTMPIGGCSRPIIRFSTTIRPKCTGSMPSLSTTGISTGTAIRIAAVGSRKQPTNSSSRFASSRNTHGWSVNAEHPRRRPCR